ncbi:MAG TPA: 2-hydroxychromene-2-carboxylate isomerase [Rhodocyclaceae bacterium]|jgi:2-hydroxychromene-2-carboxylate isomerase|nr:2-hydroxychromene-2-carboxylate isomerase [Rhodocyclaceae bacterium]HRQ46049.1 2-hydroxychromene-2-carboxylate isomerase [Rhodocyclaceae bacterium]
MSSFEQNRAPTHADLYFDVVSPYAYLLDAVLRKEGFPLAIRLHPVLFAGLLEAHGNKGPAEIDAKREFTYQLCTWTGQLRGIPFMMPSLHPFNPLPYLRLIIALGSTSRATSTVLDALWTTGCDPEDPATWRSVLERLTVPDADERIADPQVKLQLRENTDKAVSLGIFGVPTLMVGKRLFWGLDALPMARAYVDGDPRLSTPAMHAASQTRFGAKRRTR